MRGSTDSYRSQLTLHAIHEDAAFLGKYLSALQRAENQPFAPLLAFCMGTYMALFAHEGQRQLKKIDPSLAANLSDPAQQILLRSRHSLKFFEDTKLGMTGLRSLFWDEIVPVHRAYFVSLLRFRCLERFAKDIGIYRYRGRIISTTHAASFSLGLEAGAIAQGNLGEFLLAVTREYGRYFGALGATIDLTYVAFPDFLEGSQFTEKEEDYRAADFYREIFNGPDTPDLNATLLLMLGHLNFIAEIVAADIPPAQPQYSTFKIQFLGIYQIIRSLTILLEESRSELTSQSVTVVEKIMQHPVAKILAGDEIRPLRNTLMHYNVDTRIDHTRIDIGNYSQSLAATVLCAQEGKCFLEGFEGFIFEAAQLMNDWMRTPGSASTKHALR